MSEEKKTEKQPEKAGLDSNKNIIIIAVVVVAIVVAGGLMFGKKKETVSMEIGGKEVSATFSE